MRNNFKTTEAFNKHMGFKARYNIRKLTVETINALYDTEAELYLVQGLNSEYTDTLYLNYDSAYNHIKRNFTKKKLLGFIYGYVEEDFTIKYGAEWSYTNLIDYFIVETEGIAEFFEVAFNYNKGND